MCGITGIYSTYSKNLPNVDLVKSMLSALAHRGPDGWGLYSSNDVALGHARLSILDIMGGKQPMMTDRYVITYNGEIYNYLELREELINKGVKFITKSDTEVVLKAFEYYGSECLAKLNGQFALIFWDKIKKRLIIARDRYGIRPLYILNFNGYYYFSSEMKAFDTIKGHQRSFDMNRLFDHALLWNTIGDETVYKDIRSLPAGTYEIYEKGKAPVLKRYYEIGESQGGSPTCIDIAKEEFIELLNDSVNLRLRSDVPVGAYLSGGIDSSVTTYLTSAIKKERFKSYSIVFDDKDYDESSFQKELIKQLNTKHFSQEISYRRINDNFLDAAYHFERPVFRTAEVPLYLLSSKVRSQDMKVVLTGEGADEILWGYDSFKELKLLEFWKKQKDSKLRPLLIKKLYPHLRHYKDPRQYGLMRMYYEGFLDDFDNELASLNIRVHNNQIITRYFNKDYKLVLNKGSLIERIRPTLPDNFYSWSVLQKNQFLEMKTLLSGYLLSSQGDRMSMAHSVEGRYPFLDHRLVEKLFYFNDNFKLKNFSQKYLLSESFKDKIPSSIINRPKMPYTAPDLKSFFHSGALSEQGKYFLSDTCIKDYGIFDENSVGKLVKKFNRRIPDAIGYRDNMLITFILSCQMANYWAKNPRINQLNDNEKTIDIRE